MLEISTLDGSHDISIIGFVVSIAVSVRNSICKLIIEKIFLASSDTDIVVNMDYTFSPLHFIIIYY